MISIIVPVYNVANYLERCINSLLKQTYSNLQIILVDDGSTDASPKICDDFAKKDGRIQVIHKENGGLSSARNAGISAATGEYIAFVDSDDWVISDAYEYLYDLIIKYEADVVSADYELTYGDDISVSKTTSEYKIEGSLNILKYYMLQDNLHGKNDYPVWIKLYKKNLFDNIKFPDGKIYEDNITNFKILQNCNTYVKSKKNIYAYFQRRESITKTKLTKKHLALLDVANEMIGLTEDEELKKLCNRKLAMSYLSLLSMYVRYGSDLDKTVIDNLVLEYKHKKSTYIQSETKLSLKLFSFAVCMNVHFCRFIYKIVFK